MDELDGVDLVVRSRLRVGRILLGAGAAVANGRLRVSTKSISILRALLTEMMSHPADDALPPSSESASDPPPAVDAKPPLPPPPPTA